MATILDFRPPEFAVLNFYRGLVNIVSRRSTRRYVIKPVETKSGRNRRGNRLDPGSLEETFERICFRYIHTLETLNNFSTVIDETMEEIDGEELFKF